VRFSDRSYPPLLGLFRKRTSHFPVSITSYFVLFPKCLYFNVALKDFKYEYMIVSEMVSFVFVPNHRLDLAKFPFAFMILF